VLKTIRNAAITIFILFVVAISPIGTLLLEIAN